ncbi:hypothetical protein JCM10296v2_007732 [Rhodotorula toruloides]
MANEQARILEEVEGHLAAYEKAWDTMRSYGGAGQTTIQKLEEIEEVEYELDSYDEGWLEHAEASEVLAKLRKTLKTLPYHDEISTLFAQQEREFQAVHTIERECIENGNGRLAREVERLADQAHDSCRRPLAGPHLLNRRIMQHERFTARGKRRRRLEAESQLPPVRRTNSGLSNVEHAGSTAEQALAKARRSGGGYRAGLRYFGWHY